MKISISLFGFNLALLEFSGKSKPITGDTYTNCVIDRPYPIVMAPNAKPLDTVNDDPMEVEETRKKLAEYVAKETGYAASEIKHILNTMDKFFK